MHTADLLGGKHTFEHNGRRYEVSLITQAVKIKFEQALFARAKAAAREIKDLMDAPGYAAHLKALNDSYISGDYCLESEGGLAFLRSTTGSLTVIGLIFNVDETEALTLLQEREEDVVNLLRLVLCESFPKFKEAAEQAEKEAKEGAKAGKDAAHATGEVEDKKKGRHREPCGRSGRHGSRP